MSDLPKFLIIRFAPGAAGNLISSLLQCSKEVAHLSEEWQSLKPDVNWLRYFQQVFKPNYRNWTEIEPTAYFNWGTKSIFSSKYDRGNNLSIDDVFNLEKIHCSDYYFASKQQGLMQPIFWNKNVMPAYFYNSSSVTINIDKESLRWYDRSRYKKHFVVSPNADKSVTVEHCEHKPSLAVNTNYHYHNEYISTYPSFKTFVREKIINYSFRNNFLNLSNVQEWPINNVNIDLSDLINPDRLFDAYIKICNKLNITPVKKDTILSLQQYWLDCHI